MIVDASALVALTFMEDDEATYAQALRDAATLHIAPINWWEAFARAERSKDPSRRGAFVQVEEALRLTLVPTDATQLTVAKHAWRLYGKGSGHRAQLNMGDCFAYALAKTLDEPLLFKGDDFTHTDVRSAL